VTKAEFIDRVSNDDRIDSKKAATDAVEAVLDGIVGALKSGEDVNFTGFGKFSVNERGPPPGCQPAYRRADHDPGRQGSEVLRRRRT
jgi:DNA-binding protein HU-beta